jgi:hypothetical protein
MKTNIQKVAVVSTPRTGSTFICELLEQHPQILGLGEAFIHNDDGRKFYHYKATGETRFFPGDHKLAEYMEYLEAIARLEDKTKIAFKLMDYQSAPLWDAIERDTSILLIKLRRRNTLESFASMKASEISKVWHGHTEEDIRRAAEVKVHLDFEEYLEWHKRCVALEHRVAGLLNPTLTLDYSHFTKYPEIVATRMFGFIGVNPEIGVEIRQKKLNPRLLKDRISNFWQIREKGMKHVQLANNFNEDAS